MKKLLQGFIFGYLLFCGLSAFATPGTEWPIIRCTDVYFPNGSGGQPPDGDYTYNRVLSTSYGTVYIWRFGSGEIAWASGAPVYWAYRTSYYGADAIESSSSWATGVGSSLYSGMSIPPAETNSASTNIIVSANTNDGSWNLVISQGVNMATNITQINVSINSLMGASENTGSVFKDVSGDSVFKDIYGVSYFRYLFNNFLYKVHFTNTALDVTDARHNYDADGRLKTSVDWENMPEFPSEISATISGPVSIDGSLDLADIRAKLEVIGTKLWNVPDIYVS